MNFLADYTSPALIVPRWRGKDAAAVIQELSAALQREGCVPDLLQFYHAALNREYLCSTAAAPGWALPHAPVRGLARPYFAVGRGRGAVPWTAPGQLPVRLVFLFAIPATDARIYMGLIAALARLSQDRERAETLLNAPDNLQLFDALKHVPIVRNPSVMPNGV